MGRLYRHSLCHSLRRKLGVKWRDWRSWWWIFLSTVLLLCGMAFGGHGAGKAAPAVEQAFWPVPQKQPMPPTLANWQDTTGSGDYFDQIETTEVNYLLWTRFPIRVYVQPVDAVAAASVQQRSQRWFTAVNRAISEWQPYLPFQSVDQPEQADIQILRATPPLRILPAQPGDTRLRLDRVRTAETRYALFRQKTLPPILVHRCVIYLTPNQGEELTKATARHEFGHALGIWGHSPQETDVMYFSQVRNPPPISARDLNTLKRIYQQPTRLGWPFREPPAEPASGSTPR